MSQLNTPPVATPFKGQSLKGSFGGLRRLLLTALATLVFPVLLMGQTHGAANDNTVLIYGPGTARTVWSASATTLGYSVEVATSASWNLKTAIDFATYRAIVLPDNTCSGQDATVVNSRTTWGPAVSGNVLVVGGDPDFHTDNVVNGNGASKQIYNGIKFAASWVAHTGLFIPLGCSSNATVLDVFGTWTSTGSSTDAVHIVATHPALTGLTDANQSNWGSSTHTGFTAYPAGFVPLAIQDGRGASPCFPDGHCGYPYLLAKGAGVQSVGLNISKTAPGTVNIGDTITYTLTYANTSIANATGVVITDPIPAGTTFVSATGGGTQVGSNVVWNIGNLAAGSTGNTVTFTVSVINTGVISNNNYTIAGDGLASVIGATVYTNVPGLGITLGGPGTTSIGSNITYTITYANTGILDAANAVITNPLPAGTTFVSATNGGTYDPVTGNVTWNVGTIAHPSVGNIVYFTVTVNGPGNITNSGCGIAADSPLVPATAEAVTSVLPVASTYTLTYTAGANGSISGTSPQTVAAGGSGSAVTAVPATGYHFTTWSDGVATATRTDTGVAANKSVTASFAINTYTITASAGANGSISPNGVTTLNHGGSQAYTITPAANYHVADVLVDGSSVGAVTSRTFSAVTASHTIAVTFAIDTHMITASAGTGGSITASAAINHGASATYSVTPNSGYRIAEVVVDGVSQGVISSYTFSNVTAAHTIGATFDGTVGNFSVSTNGDANGTITPAYLSVLPGACLTVIITPDRGYKLGSLTLDGVSESVVSNQGELALLNITTHHLVNVTFTKKTYTLTPSAGLNGSISPATAQTASYGDTVTFTITPSAGFSILDVKVDGVSMGAVGTLTLPKVMADHTITVTFH